VFLLWAGLNGVFVAYAALHVAIAAAAYTMLLGREWPSPPDWRTARAMIGFAARLYIANLAMFLVLRLDLFLLNALAGTREAGLYSVAVQIGDILMLTTASVATILFPRLTAMEAGQRWRATRRVLKVSGLILAAMAFGLAAIARPVFLRWFGVEFADSTIALYWLLPGLWCLAMNTLLYQHLSAFGMPTFMAVSTCAGAAFNAAVNLWAIPRYGLGGAAAVSSATYVLLLLSTVLYMNLSRGRELTA
jgi:O-antigen/teichoic acid export membrane protein